MTIMNPLSYQFNNEIIINKSIQILDKTCYVLSISDDHINQYLWVMYKHIRYDNVSELQPLNYRELYEMQALSNQIHPSLDFQNIRIQGQESNITTAQYFYTPKKNNFLAELFKHFQDKSFDILDKNNNYYIIRMTIESPLKIDSDKPLSLSLKKSVDLLEHIINQEVVFNYDDEQVVEIKNPITHKVMKYHFSPILHYDIHSEYDNTSMPVDLKERFSLNRISLCPEDEVIQVIAYDVEEDFQLSIYSKEKLASPMKQAHQSSGISIFLGYEFSDRKGQTSFSCNLGHVKPNTKKPIDAEIFSVHIIKEGLWYNIE